MCSASGHFALLYLQLHFLDSSLASGRYACLPGSAASPEKSPLCREKSLVPDVSVRRANSGRVSKWVLVETALLFAPILGIIIRVGNIAHDNPRCNRRARTFGQKLCDKMKSDERLFYEN